MANASSREYHARCVEITQAEDQALRDKCEELAEYVRALSTLVHALRGRWLRWGW